MFVIVIVFVFVIVFLMFRSCLLISLIKCLKGHKSLGSLVEGFLFIVFVILFVFVIVFLMFRSCPLITLIKCLIGHKFLELLCSVVKTLIVSGVRGTDRPRDKVTYLAFVDS